MLKKDSMPTWQKLSLFAVTWPIFIDLILRMMLGTADVFMLSRISDDTVAAVGLANEIIAFCIIMFGFIGLGTSVVVAQYLGAGRKEEATKISALAITLNLLFGLLISVLLVSFSDQWLQLFKLKPELMDTASHYLKIIGGFIFIEAVSYAISSVVRSGGHTKDVMYVTFGVNIIHVIGNYLLIFGNFGFPEWGVTGAAISTVVSRSLGIIVMFIILYKRTPVMIRIKDYFSIRLNHIKQILSIGLPAAGEHLSWQTSQMMVMIFINMIGKEALSTHVYVMNISFYLMAVGVALGSGTEILVGHMVGAGEKEMAYKRLMKSLRLGFLVTIGIVLSISLFRENIMDLFTDNKEIISVGASILLLSLLLEPGRTFNLVVINSLRATGDARFPVLMGVLSMWGVSVPLSYLFGVYFELGLLGIYMAFTVDEWLRGILMLLRWRSRVWEKKALVKPMEPQLEPQAASI